MTATETSIPHGPATAGYAGSKNGFFSIGGRVLLMSFPLMVGSLTAATQAIAKLGLLTYHNDTQALYIFSMVTPGFILMLAFMESLAVANQVFSSRSVKNWPKGDIQRATKFFSILGSVLISLVGLGIYGVQNFIPTDSVMHPIMPKMALFVLSFIPFFIFEVRNAALRGQGRTGLALIPFAVLIIVDFTATAVGILVLNLGFDAILIGNLAGPIAAFPVIYYLLNREVGEHAPSVDQGYKRNVIRMLIGVGVPTFLTTFAGSIAAMVIFPMLANFGEDTASSFILVIRMRVLFIIPAIAAGSAIAIMINTKGDHEHGEESRRILTYGTAMIALIYVIATAVLYVFHADVVGLMVPAQNMSLRSDSVTLLGLLIFTFFLLGVGTMVQIILEHLGKGAQVLVITLLAEAITVGLAIYLLKSGGDLPLLTMVMTAAAAFSMVAYGIFLLRLVKKMDAPHAV
ncbi:MAG: hypothetical protein ACSHXB_16095 [Sulfitobacter sp.]